MFCERMQSFSGGNDSFARKGNCSVRKCKISRGNAIFLQEKANGL